MTVFAQPLITDFEETPQGDLIGLTNPDGAQCRMIRPPMFETASSSYAALYAEVTNPVYVSPDGDDTKDGSTLAKRKATIASASTSLDGGSTPGWIVLCASGFGVGNATFRQGIRKSASAASFATGSKVLGIAVYPGCRAIVDGRDVFTGWTYVAGKGWSHAYNPPFDMAVDPHASRKLVDALTATALTMKATAGMGPLNYGSSSTLPRLVKNGSEWLAVTAETPIAATNNSTYTITRGCRGTTAASAAAAATLGQSMPPQDQLFVDGVPYVLDDTDSASAGEFWVDQVANKIYIGEASTWDPTAHTIEVGMRGADEFNTTGGGGSPVGIQKAGFKQYGLVYAGWAGDPTLDDGAPLRLGAGNIMKQCVVSYAPWLGIGIGGDNVTIDQVVIHAAGMGFHSNATSNVTISNTRVHHPNWTLKLDVSPSDVARFAGSKVANSVNWTYDGVLYDQCMANGLWHDVRCKNTVVQNSSFTDCLGYGVTQEVGTIMDILGCFFARCGRDHGDNFRMSGVPHGRICNNLSVDSWGYAMGLYEDWRTYPQNATANTITTAQRSHSHFMGDTFDTLVKNNVLVVCDTTTGGKSTSPGQAWGGANGLGNSALIHNNDPGFADGAPDTSKESDSLGFAQDASFSTAQMVSSDPWAATLDGQSDFNVIIDLTSHTAKSWKFCTPTKMRWNDTGSGSPTATTAYNLAGVKAATVNEDHSIEILQVASGTKKMLGDYFPNLAAHGDGRWTGGTIPTDGSTNSGATVPADIADTLGIAGSGARTARFGPYKYPIPRALGTASIIGSQVSTRSLAIAGPLTLTGTQVTSRSIAVQGGGNVVIVGTQTTSASSAAAGALITTTNLPPAVAWDNTSTPANNASVQGTVIFTVTATDDHGFAVDGVELWVGDSVADLAPTGLAFTQRDADTWDLEYDTTQLQTSQVWVFRANGTDNGTPPLQAHSFARNLTVTNPVFGAQVTTTSVAIGQAGIVRGAQVTSRSIAILGGGFDVAIGSQALSTSVAYGGTVVEIPNGNQPPAILSVSLNAGDSIGQVTIVMTEVTDDQGIDHVDMVVTKPDGSVVTIPMN